MRLRHLVLLPALALLGAGCWDIFAVRETQNTPIILKRETNKEPVSSISGIEGVSLASSTEVVETPPPLKPGEIASASGNVVVSSFAPKQTLSSPFVILGRARAFENVIRWRIRDKNGETLASGMTKIDAPDAGRFGQYRISSFLRRVPTRTAGKVEVFTNSPRDGSEQDMVSVTVKLNTDMSAVKIFFSNIVKDPQAKQCDKTYAVTRRIPKTVNLAEAALLELLDGPSAAELTQGSRTAIIPGTQLRSVNVEGDVATADFSREIGLGLVDECIVKAFRSQIEQTLKQFPNIKVVKIKIDGVNIDDILKQ